MKKIILGRLRRLVEKSLSLSFLTWLTIFVAFWVRGQLYDLDFLIFTAAVIGIRTFQNGIELTKSENNAKINADKTNDC